MAARPDGVDGLVARSIEHLTRNELAQAEFAARQALMLEPSALGALNALGFALHAQGKHRDSEQAYLQMTAVQPGEPMHWMNVGTARRCDDRIDEALYAFARAAALGAAGPDFHYNVALAHIGRDDHEAAYSLLKKAFDASPGDAEIRYRFAFCCYETLRTEEALAALEPWERLPDAAPEIAAGAGHLLMKLGEIERAEPAVRNAALRGSEDPQATLTLIQLLERTNRLVEARALLDQLQSQPAAAVLGSDLKVTAAQLAQRESQHGAAIGLFTEVLADNPERHLRHFQLYPLAKSLDAVGQYDEAFSVLIEAHASQLAYLELTAPLAAAQGARPLTIAEHSCEAADVAAWDHAEAPDAAHSPIFIVGFPRSGTTLLELVLDAHPRLQSIDEQPYLQNALDDLLSAAVRYPGEMAPLDAPLLQRIRDAYWARTARRLRLEPGQRLIDKNPLNILRLPVIKRLFPAAKILLAVRHPCDVILSCYMQHFRAPDFVLLCKDVPSLAQAYRKTFDFWFAQQALLQADVFELRYESFVANFDAEVRGLFGFLEVPWDDAVLSPAARAQEKRFISTPSYAQVVQPVTGKAVGRWLNYRRHFTAGLPPLSPYLSRWGYSA